MLDLTAHAPRALSLLRIFAGLLFLEHATQKFFAFPAPFPLPGPLPPLLVAAGVIELVAGALITLGLFTRLAALIASGEMAIAYFVQHAPAGFWPGRTGDPFLLHLFLSGVCRTRGVGDRPCGGEGQKLSSQGTVVGQRRD